MSDDLAGRTLGRYQVLERLGRGGMAEVYRAYQPSLDRYVAIKVIYPHLATDQALLERFGREARAVAALHHPNIVQVHDFDVQSGTAFMAMEFVSGPTLKAAIQSLSRRGQLLPLHVVGQIVGQIGDALAYAHEQKVVHRDVKPANVLIRRRAHSDTPITDAEIDELLLNLGPTSVVLTDFGVARIIKDSVEHTAAGTILGSPAYMSPEQGRGERVDARSDIYSLGVVLFELLTGQVPFDADTPFAIVLKHTTAALPAPRSLRPDLPEGLERVLLKALAKDPADRFQDAGAFGAAVREQSGVRDQATARLVSAAAAAAPIPERPSPRETRLIELTRSATPSVPAAQAQASPAAPPAKPPRRSPLRRIIGVVIAMIALALVALVAFIAGGATVFRGLGQAGALVVPSPFSAEATAAAAQGTVIPFVERSPDTSSGPASTPDLSNPVVAALIRANEECVAPGCPDGNAGVALDILNAAIEEQPDSAELLAARSLLYVWWDPYTYRDAARDDAAAALDIDPQSAVAYLARGGLTEAIAEDDASRAQALDDYNRAIEIDPELIEARLARANFLAQTAEIYNTGSPNHNQAIADTSFVLERQPENLDALNLRADIYYNSSSYEESLADSSAVLEIDPGNIRALMRRGQLYRYYLSQPEQAISDFGAVIEIEPNNFDAREGRAALLVIGEDYEAALEDANAMIAAESGRPFGYIFHGFVQLALERPQQALQDFERALAFSGPTALDARYGRARALLGRREIEQAVSDLEAVAADPDALSYVSDVFFGGHNRVFLDLAFVYVELGRLDEAGPLLDTAVERDGSWHVPYLARARYRIRTGDPEGAREDLRNAFTYAQTDAERDEIDRELRQLPTR